MNCPLGPDCPRPIYQACPQTFVPHASTQLACLFRMRTGVKIALRASAASCGAPAGTKYNMYLKPGQGAQLVAPWVEGSAPTRGAQATQCSEQPRLLKATRTCFVLSEAKAQLCFQNSIAAVSFHAKDQVQSSWACVGNTDFCMFMRTWRMTRTDAVRPACFYAWHDGCNSHQDDGRFHSRQTACQQTPSDVSMCQRSPRHNHLSHRQRCSTTTLLQRRQQAVWRTSLPVKMSPSKG